MKNLYPKYYLLVIKIDFNIYFIILGQENMFLIFFTFDCDLVTLKCLFWLIRSFYTWKKCLKDLWPSHIIQMMSVFYITLAWLLAAVFALPVPLNSDLKIHELEPKIQRVLGYRNYTYNKNPGEYKYINTSYITHHITHQNINPDKFQLSKIRW